MDCRWTRFSSRTSIFFLARLGAIAVGCGGVALFPDFAEVKRMYVRHAPRGRRVPDAVLARIEAETRRAGLTILLLETGDNHVADSLPQTRARFQHRAP